MNRRPDIMSISSIAWEIRLMTLWVVVLSQTQLLWCWMSLWLFVLWCIHLFTTQPPVLKLFTCFFPWVVEASTSILPLLPECRCCLNSSAWKPDETLILLPRVPGNWNHISPPVIHEKWAKKKTPPRPTTNLRERSGLRWTVDEGERWNVSLRGFRSMIQTPKIKTVLCLLYKHFAHFGFIYFSQSYVNLTCLDIKGWNKQQEKSRSEFWPLNKVRRVQQIYEHTTWFINGRAAGVFARLKAIKPGGEIHKELNTKKAWTRFIKLLMLVSKLLTC